MKQRDWIVLCIVCPFVCCLATVQFLAYLHTSDPAETGLHGAMAVAFGYFTWRSFRGLWKSRRQ